MPRKGDLIARFWAKVDNTAGPLGCWTWTGVYSKKRPSAPPRPVFWVAYLVVPGERVRTARQMLVAAARMALSLTDGVCLDERAGLEACHRCANVKCVNPGHLYWGTAEDNLNDRYATTTVADIRERLGSL